MPLINTTGRHDVTTKQGSFGESKNGTPFFELLFADDNGNTINGWLYLSDKAFEASVKTLRETFGFDGNFETLPDQVANKRCSITTEEEEFENKMRLKVKWINPLRTVIPLKGGNELLKQLSAKAARIPVESRPKAPPAPKAATTADTPSNPQNFGDFPS
jgi:hypothetical protein